MPSGGLEGPQADDGSGAILLRLNNPSSAAVTARITAGLSLDRRLAGAMLVDILELPAPAARELTADQDGAVSIPLPAHGLSTVQLSLTPLPGTTMLPSK